MPAAAAPTERPLEVCWFAALCDDDYEQLGIAEPRLASSWEHCSNIVTTAERLGFDNILLPSGYSLGIDPIAFAGGVAPLLRRMSLLVAIRCGEMWPPQLARQLATLAEMLAIDPVDEPAHALPGQGRSPSQSRLTVNIISSDLPGAPLDSASRYRRTLEIMEILRTLLSGQPVEHHGEFFDLELEPPRILGEATPPPFYFGGLSEPARDVAARAADVFLMWPDTMSAVDTLIADMRDRARRHGRNLRFGYRVHVVVRDTEAEARAAAAHLVAELDPGEGSAIRSRSLDTASVGVARQTALRDHADDDGYAEEFLWTGIGRARSGCGAAVVGDPEQVAAKLLAYRAAGIDTLILSGYPHIDEAERFARDVLPLIRRQTP